MDHGRLRAEFNDDHPMTDADNGQLPTTLKVHRVSKACIQCRGRKQKCSGPGTSSGSRSATSEHQARQPCRRCVRSAIQCSFTASVVEHESGSLEAASRKVDRLQKQVGQQASRISRLEATVSDLVAAGRLQTVAHARRASSDALPVLAPDPPSVYGTRTWHDEVGVLTDASPVLRRAPNVQDQDFGPVRRSDAQPTVDFGTPMSMLRHNISDLSMEIEALDPITCGVLTMQQAQETFDTFFQHCHRWAPVLCPRTQTCAATIREACPALFISVCCVGYRFTSPSVPEAHRRYMTLISLLDHSLSRLLLRPNMADVSLDHIRAILLYIQWMPVDKVGSSTRCSRYNAISAWGMLGLAIRYALFLGLHQDAVLPFKTSSDETPTPTLEDVGRLRVWINLLTCDAALTLLSGLPATLNPDPVVAVADCFKSHRSATHPDDTRTSATCKLVSILKRAVRSSGSPSARSLDAACLRQVNLDLDTWETTWSPVIGDKIQHYQMPFTTLRSYRLAMNSACLSSLLRPSGGPGQISIHVLEALQVSLHTAALTIFALSEQSKHQPWEKYTSCSIDSLPQGRYTLDMEAIGRIKYSVDSTWISYSFAAMFLVLCYKGGLVDENLKIVALCHSNADMVTFPQRQASSSLLSRLAFLAMQILEAVSTDLLVHPALDHKSVLSGVFAAILGDDLVKDDELVSETPATAPYSDREVEALFHSMVNGMDLSWRA